jgi:hypothetical protein
MNALRTLPPDYRLIWTLDLKTDRRLLIGLNAATVIMFVPAALLAGALVRTLDPQASSSLAVLHPPGSVFLNVITYLISAVLVIVLHEIIHGLFFWGITREMPSFGIGTGYAFASAPGWYIPRGAYLWIGIAPLLVLTLGCLLISPLLPLQVLYPVLFGVVLNGVGSLGDGYVVVKLLSKGGDLLVCDHGDKIDAFTRLRI